MFWFKFWEIKHNISIADIPPEASEESKEEESQEKEETEEPTEEMDTLVPEEEEQDPDMLQLDANVDEDMELNKAPEIKDKDKVISLLYFYFSKSN